MSESVYCITHQGVFQKDSATYEEHNTTDCQWEQYDPKVHIPDFADYTIDKPKNQKTVEMLYEFAKTQIRKLVISRDDSNQIFAVVSDGDHCKTISMNQSSIDWFSWNYYQVKKKTFSVQSWEQVINLICASAKFGNDATKETIYNRVAMNNGTIYYDMGEKHWRLVKITPDSVEMVDYDQTMPLFVRGNNQGEQITPNYNFEGNPLESLVLLLKIPESDRQIFKVHLVSEFLESISVPIMTLTGEQGSTKSTNGKTVKRIVDPSGIETSSFPKRHEDIVLHLYNRYMTNFDNVSKFGKETSDLLCRAVTGEGYPKRKLYEDTDEVILKYKRKIVLNGITPSLEYSDLRERTINYELQKVPEEQRLTDEKYDAILNQMMPSLIGQIFLVLRDVLRKKDEVAKQITRLPRMADFVQYGETISQVLGYESGTFLEEYNKKLLVHSLEYHDEYPIIALIELLMEGKEEYNNSVSKFLEEIRTLAQANDIDVSSQYIKFPRTANKVTPHIKQIMTDIRQQGFGINSSAYNSRDGKFSRGSHVISIWKINVRQTSLPSLSLQSNTGLATKIISSDRDRPALPELSMSYLDGHKANAFSDGGDIHDRGDMS